MIQGHFCQPKRKEQSNLKPWELRKTILVVMSSKAREGTQPKEGTRVERKKRRRVDSQNMICFIFCNKKLFIAAAEEFTLPSVTVEFLQQEKTYAKMGKKYIKELDGLQKKHAKERNTIVANQCKAMEKLAKSKKYEDIAN